MEQFFCKTKILSGPGAIKTLADMGIQRLLLVTDPYFTKTGIAQQVASAAKAEHVEIFDKIQPDPSVELAAEGTAAVKRAEPDTVVALGGGSAMDCAKAMVYFAELPVRLVAIPTTSGSGSEVTDFAVLTHGQVKYPLVDERLQPQVAILDSNLLEKLPAGLVADTGFDVLTHALEAFVATGAGLVTDALAQGAFCTVLDFLLDSFRGDTEVRGKIHEAATMAGMAFSSAGLGVCHAFAHSLGGLFHLPHGRLNAMLLPAVISCNGAAQKKYANMARAAGLGGLADTLAVRNLRNALIRLRRELNMPETLAQAGVDPRQVRQKSHEILDAVLADPCCSTNPVPVDRAMAAQILEEVTGRV